MFQTGMFFRGSLAFSKFGPSIPKLARRANGRNSMGLYKLGAAALGLALGLVATSPATAAANIAIERSGNTFHKAACAHNQQFGRARCFAHIVTDSAGRTRTFQPTGRPNFNFTGYTPADLRAAYK